MEDVPGYDGHTHTKYSDGRNSILENVRGAEIAGLSCVAITDHLLGDEDWLPVYLDEIGRVQRQTSVKVVSGCEGTIRDTSGELGLELPVASELCLVLADLGGRTEGVHRDAPVEAESLARNVADCYINCCQRGLVDAIAHPFNLGRFEAKLMPDDFPRPLLDEVAEAMVTHDVAFEIMNQMWWWFPELSLTEFSRSYLELVKVFRERGVKFTIGSDAHSCGAVGNLVWAHRLLRAAEIPRQQMVNLAALVPHGERGT